MTGRSNFDKSSKKSRLRSEASSIQGSMTDDYKREVQLPEIKKKRVNKSTFTIKPRDQAAPSERSSICQSRMDE
jgi:hypothetical protein